MPLESIQVIWAGQGRRGSTTKFGEIRERPPKKSYVWLVIITYLGNLISGGDLLFFLFLAECPPS